MKYAHGIEIKHVKKIWKEDICKITRLNKKKMPRKRIQEVLEPILQKHLDVFEKAKKEIHNNRQVNTEIEDFRPQRV
jgi:hypothetical protein